MHTAKKYQLDYEAAAKKHREDPEIIARRIAVLLLLRGYLTSMYLYFTYKQA
jgi:hypothetical protein